MAADSRVPIADRKGLAGLLNRLEASPRLWVGDRHEVLAELDRAYREPRPGARVIGLTGPPGVGKSTLSGRLIRQWRARGLTVGVLCVDPSSRRSGGALLGDRLRMQLDGVDDGVFVRSMAARERLGGLAPMTLEAVVAMRHHCDRVLVETVGVGQSETDIATLADVTLVVIQPGSGDMLQFIKAGLMEVFGALVVNKSDLGAQAEATRRELMAALRATGRRDAEVFMTSARDDVGIASMIEVLENRDIAPSRLHAALIERALDEYATWFGLSRLESEGGRATLRARLATADSPLTIATTLL